MAGQLRLIAQIKDEKEELVGYSVLHIGTNRAKMYAIPEVKVLINDLGCVNAVVKDGKIKGTEASLDRLPIYGIDGKLVAQPRVTVLAQLISNGNIVGYALMDAYGRTGRFTVEDAIKYIDKFESTNAKIVQKTSGEPGKAVAGPRFISAIYGEFTKVEINADKPSKVMTNEEKAFETDEKSINDKTKQEPFARKLSEARYIGETGASVEDQFSIRYYVDRNNALKYYGNLLRIKQAKEDLIHEGDTVSITLKKSSVKEVTDLLYDVSKGKFGSRTKKHYPLAMKVLEEMGNPRNSASTLKLFKATALKNVSYRKYLSKTDCFTECTMPDKVNTAIYLAKFEEAVILDALNYKKINLVAKLSKDLLDMLSQNAEACKYIQSKTGWPIDRKALTDIIMKAAKNRIDGVSSAMFISALEIMWISKSIDIGSRRGAMMSIVYEAAKYNDAEPKAIEDESDYGAMILQALIIAAALKR